jgi:uroporphyrinogen decarboxylase
VWFMRQAGRSLPEYRASRKGLGMLESCMRPELVAEITLQPVRRYGVDAAVLYSDIMLPLKAAGVDLDIVPGQGPVIARPVRTTGDLEQLQPLDAARVWYVSEAVGLITSQLDGVPLIGFAGAPFTLASYLVEGGPSRDYAATKALMISEPSLWHEMCTRLADLSAAFLKLQVAAGASVVQLFDSWAGSLSAEDYRRYAQPYSARVLAALANTGVPRIHFGVGTSELLGLMGAAGAEVIGVDWRLPLEEASRRVGHRYALQGYLDPALLSASWPVLSARVREVIVSGAAAPGHIFNLGHGVPPAADPAVLAMIVELVHTEGPQLRRTAREQLAAEATAAGAPEPASRAHGR